MPGTLWVTQRNNAGSVIRHFYPLSLSPYPSKTMHIVHYNLTTTTKEGGVETFVWDLAGEQARRGERVTIVGGAGPVRRSLPGVSVRTAPFIARERFAFGPLRRAYAWRKLAERLSLLPAALPLLRGAELVHIHKPYDLVLAPLLRGRGIPLVYHGHGRLQRGRC